MTLDSLSLESLARYLQNSVYRYCCVLLKLQLLLYVTLLGASDGPHAGLESAAAYRLRVREFI